MTSTPPRERRARASRSARILLAALTAVIAFQPVKDIDAFWHLARGALFLENGLEHDSDPFSHTAPDRRPDRQAWLGDVCFHVARAAGGLLLLRLLCALIVIAGILAVERLLRSAGADVLSAFAGSLVILALFRDRIQHRPDLFSLPFSLIVTSLVLSLPASRSWSRLAVLAGVSALWANLHPGAVVAPLLGAACSFRRAALARPATLLAIPFAGAAILLTPDGTGIYAYLFETAPLRKLIPEWQSIFELGLSTFWPEATAIVVMAALLTFLWKPRSQPAPETAPPVLAGIFGIFLAASAARFIHFLFLPVACVMGARPGSSAGPWRTGGALAIAASLLLLGADFERRRHAAEASGLSVFGDIHEPQYPIALADFLEDARLDGPLYNPPAFGGYLIDRLHPHYRVAIDGRVTFFGERLATDMLAILRSPDREALIDRYGFEIVALPVRVKFESARFQPVYADGTAALYVRLGTPRSQENLERARRALRRR